MDSYYKTIYGAQKMTDKNWKCKFNFTVYEICEIVTWRDLKLTVLVYIYITG